MSVRLLRIAACFLQPLVFKCSLGLEPCHTGAAASQCVTPRGVQPFWGL